jgi:hypothetical protein
MQTNAIRIQGNDSRRSKDEYKNGMEAAGSVMKPTGSVMKSESPCPHSVFDAQVVANRALLLNLSAAAVFRRKQRSINFFLLLKRASCACRTRQEAEI